jgi:hypothetical protein
MKIANGIRPHDIMLLWAGATVVALFAALLLQVVG